MREYADVDNVDMLMFSGAKKIWGVLLNHIDATQLGSLLFILQQHSRDGPAAYDGTVLAYSTVGAASLYTHCGKCSPRLVRPARHRLYTQLARYSLRSSYDVIPVGQHFQSGSRRIL